MTKITVERDGAPVVLEAEAGEDYLSLLRRHRLSVPAVCGGKGTCGKCRIVRRAAGRAEEVLACQTVVQDGDTVVLPKSRRGGLIEGADAVDEATAEAVAGLPACRAAVDLGTTTIAVRLLDPARPRELLVETAWNEQGAYGADVLARVKYTMEHEGGVEKLQDVVAGQISSLLARLLPAGQPDAVYIAGNTIMEHMAAGLDAAGIAQAPFMPQTLFCEAADYALGGSGVPAVYAPCIAGYVGGDITAGLYASGITKKKGTYLFLDIGTNGEMALSHDGRVTCCAVASGPAFEGAGISCGMASTEGAVNHVVWDGSAFRYDVIGGGVAAGLCGSGLLDLAAELVRCRIIDGGGRLLAPDELDAPFDDFVTEDENENGLFHLTEKVAFTAADVRQLQLAKAAVAAGIELLMKAEGVSFDDIDGLILAGGFGTHLRAASACEIGMIPKELEKEISSVGNASLAGVTAMAVSPEARAKMLAISRESRYLELSGNADFNDVYIDHMAFYEDEEDDEWN